MSRDGTDERIIEKVGAFDPLDEGFQVHGSLFGTVVQNAERTGLIGWSITSREHGGGYYFRSLSTGQKRRALMRGWTLSATIRPEEGAALAVANFAAEGNRYDLNVFVESDVYLIRLNTQIVPHYQGLELRIPRTAAAHKFDLRFDPGLQTADLWVDGAKRLEGYRGHTQFLSEKENIMFGATPYKSEQGVATFLGVRLRFSRDLASFERVWAPLPSERILSAIDAELCSA